MASKRLFSDEDFMCPVCCDIFKEPVLLSCGHSACSSCVHRYWDIKGYKECPLCRKRSVTDPPVNLALKNLSKTFLKIRGDPETLCDIHGQKLKLFCVTDGHAVCVQCSDSIKHTQHSFIPVDEAASQLKDILTSAVNTLKIKRKSLQDAQFHCHKNVDHIKAEYIRNQIKEEFKKLRQFLQKENQAMITQLKKEEQEKTKSLESKINKMNQEIQSLSDTIVKIHKEFEFEDIKFLKNFDRNLAKADCKDFDPNVASSEVIDVAMYVGNLQFRLWNKMQSIIKYSPVILNPNTAHSQLILSPDLTSMRDTDEDHEEKADIYRPPVLDTPGQFRSLCVLGSEGFSSGLHCWNVEVGNSTFWMLGVTTETVQRKKPSVFPSGAWSIGYNDQKLCARSPSGEHTALTLAPKPQVVKIRLDMDLGEVWFIDTASNTVMHMFSHQFTEKVFPFFHSTCSLYPLKIIPLQPLVVLSDVVNNRGQFEILRDAEGKIIM
ncbi:zinc-binding protein A33-like isoform 2-T2 [Clarias gariepinus]|uniref:zinc-binding protein A33-like isoform X2 n=1 Tax=Clarias gariepinus TaxID=13013 RepID=UPI00234DD7F8|nr:zinc-binding protein A33-like isoform X2 [Clarias gariepinus]